MYQVLWHPVAYEELMVVLASADAENRGPVIRKVRELGDRLRVDPLNEGETRPDGRRIAFELPIVAIYRIERHPATVRVLHIWLAPSRGGRS